MTYRIRTESLLTQIPAVNKAQYIHIYLDLRWLVHRSPLNIMVELLHDSEPLFQYGCGVICIVIRGCPAGAQRKHAVRQNAHR